MKNSHNKKAKLTLDKLRISKLDNPGIIKGGVQGNQNGGNVHLNSDTFVDEICQLEDLL
ncbi:hypothetical protein [Aquimarina sp. 2304DJ70-9]|uniref:hypothetical protein n=1 Tax=Aquimarina penaris TaxID=3231044 RepID=UPI0034637376